jgi:NitT/TauT family transport system substrate-binding protein
MTAQTSTFTRRALLKSSAGAALAGIAAPHVANAQAVDAVKFSLEFRIYGGNAPMFLAAENGIFRDLGLDVSIDGSAGSGDAVTRVATGTHAFGTADASTAVEFGARNPSVAPKIIMTVFDRFPAVVLSLTRKPIKKLQDLVGAKLGTGTADAGVKILPALLALNKIDPASINRVTVDVKLRDTMLLKGDVDAVIGFDYTSIFNLLENGLKLEDINLLYFSEFGFDFPGNSLIVNPAVLEKNPDLVRRVALGTARAWVAAARDRDAAIAAVTKRERLLKAATERQRMDWVIDRLVLTPEIRQNGLGHVTAERMTKGIGVLKEGFGLAAAPTLEQVYDGRFLPPIGDRKFA